LFCLYSARDDSKSSKILITPNGSLTNLRAIFDQCINMYEHVTSVYRATYYHIKNIHCLKALLTQKSLVTVVHAFVTSCIDYCNSLLYGLSHYNSNPQNSGHLVRYYYRCQCLGPSHMVNVHFMSQLPICGIGCQQILKMPCLLKILKICSKTHLFKVVSMYNTFELLLLVMVVY